MLKWKTSSGLAATCALAVTYTFSGRFNCAAERFDPSAAAQRGYQFLVTKPYLPPDFDQETFDAVWKYCRSR